MFTKRAALGVLGKRPGAWFCIRCWAAALNLGEDSYADLRDLVRTLTTTKANLTYDTLHNEPGHILCDLESPVCEKQLTGPRRYSGWRWSVRRRRA